MRKARSATTSRPSARPTNATAPPAGRDGYVRLVHLLVERYGDLASADRLFDSLNRFAAFIDAENPDGLRVNATGADFGDWLSLPEVDGLKPHPGYEYTGAFSTTPRPIVDTAHSYRTFVQLAEIADRLGHADYAERHRLRAEQIRQAYLDAFVQEDGSIRDATQTAYAQAIDWGIVRGEGAAAGGGAPAGADREARLPDHRHPRHRPRPAGALRPRHGRPRGRAAAPRGDAELALHGRPGRDDGLGEVGRRSAPTAPSPPPR